MPESVRQEKLEGDYRGGNQTNEKMERKEIDLEHMAHPGRENGEGLPDSGDSGKEGARENNLGSTPTGSQGSGQPVSPE